MRDIIIVDLETGGLGKDAPTLEVAAVNLSSREELRFVPYLFPDWMKNVEPVALQINRYYERGLFNETLEAADSQRHYQKLRTMLDGNTFAGSNPTFDSARLQRPIGTVWHHRLLDLSAYAAGVLGTHPGELKGLEAVCESLGVVNDEPHSALGDARATAECFRRLMELRP